MNNNTINQKGRSMIEMLGVLAIVGVLSVGGIAGYSKAMQKYRTNKTIEQVTQIINGVRTLYSQQKNYKGIGGSVLKKAKILPESAFEGNTPKNPFGGSYELSNWGRTTNNDNKAVIFTVNYIPDDACIELATQDWGAGEGLFAVNINSVANGDLKEGCYGAKGDRGAIGCAGASGPGSVPLPIPMDVALLACVDDNNNRVGFFFY